MNKQDVKEDLMFLGKLSDYAKKHLNVKLSMFILIFQCLI